MNVTRLLKIVGIAVGAGSIVGGFGVLLLSESLGGVPASLLLANVASVGAVVLAGWVARTRYRSASRQTVVPRVEHVFETPAPGDEIDTMIYRLTRLRERTIEFREQIQEKIADVAVGVIMQRDDCSREQAVEQLREGTWTSNERAAGYFSGSASGGSRSLIRQAWRRFTDADTEYERQLVATVSALESEARVFTDKIGSGDGATREDGEPTSMRLDDIAVEEVGERVTETTRYAGQLRTHHWTGASAFALLTVALGVIITEPTLLLAGAVGAAVAGYTQLSGPPPLADLAVRRRLGETDPRPGEEVEVTVTVENGGDGFLPDLRIVDRVPASMRVVDGTPRLGTALRPGQSATLQYTAVAERGAHEWPTQVIGRDVSGGTERSALIDPSNEATLACYPSLRSVSTTPVRRQTSLYAGQVNTETGGDGLEFYSLRDYLPGDPMRRINWKQYAKTGEFTTVQFRQERAARVVFLFDTRESSYVSRRPGDPHAVEHAVNAAFEAFGSIYEQGHLVGVAAFDTVPCWLGPGTGDAHLERARRLFVEHPALSPLPPDVLDKEGRYVDPMTHVRRQLPENTQIFLFSPLTDSYVYEVARQLDGAGHLVTVFSPDPTAERTIGQRIATLDRVLRVLRLREHGIRVVDWDTDYPLRLELERSRRRWSG